MAGGGYLVLGEREMLPVSKNMSLGLHQIPECLCIYQKDGGGGGSRGGERERLPDIVNYETLDEFYVEALHLKGVQSVLGRVPWDFLRRSYFSGTACANPVV